MTLAGRRAAITGATMGLGRAIAESFLAAGADVAFCARDEAAVHETLGRLRAAFPQRRVHGLAADVGREADVERFLAEALEYLGGLDALVCNAAMLGPKGQIDRVDWEQWKRTVTVDLFGAVYLTRGALAALRRSPCHGKIILLSGGGATAPRPYFSAYAAAKAGLVRYGETLAEELRPDGIDVNLVSPGALNTRMLDEALEAGPAAVGEREYASALKQLETGGASLETAARLCVFLASAASDGITGKLIAAQWDPWERFAAEKERLADDVYTMRRIVPEERGWSW